MARSRSLVRTALDAARELSDAALLERIHTLVGRQSELTAELLVHLGEVDARRLYADEACPSLFTYCTERLGLSESETYKRITVARKGRELPELVERIATGRLHLSGALVLCPHLTAENHVELLDVAEGKSKRELERALADRKPKPDTAPRVRRLPVRRPDSGDAGPPPSHPAPELPQLRLASGSERGHGSSASCSRQGGVQVETRSAPADVETASRAQLEPLGMQRYKVTFTARQSLVDVLDEVQALRGFAAREAELGEVLEKALSLYRDALVKRRYGAGALGPEEGDRRPEPERDAIDVPAPESVGAAADPPAPKRDDAGPSSTPGGASSGAEPPVMNEAARAPKPRSRHVPAEVRSAVYRRDGGRCTFVDGEGRRCSARHGLELHHVDPFGRGGEHSVANVYLRCKAHNLHAALDDFGAETMGRYLRPRCAGESPVPRPSVDPMGAPSTRSGDGSHRGPPTGGPGSVRTPQPAWR